MNTQPDMETCICGETFIVEAYMIDLERKLCEDCFNREAYIVLLQNKFKQLKHDRPYPVHSLTRLQEYHATKKKLTD
jgi:hypothetical protein